MSRRLEDLHPILVSVWQEAEKKWNDAHPNGPQVFLVYTYRPKEEQTKLYNQPRDGKDNDGDGKIDERDEFVTNAKAGQSPHNYNPSFAFDVAFKEISNKNGMIGKLNWDIKLFNEFAKMVKQTVHAAKILWGGDFKSFKDSPHFELRGWKAMIGTVQVEPQSYELKHPMMKGEKVKEIQRKLGLKLIDGVFGTTTHLAVKQFQQQNKLLIDGKVGPKTAAKMGIKL